MPQQLYVVLSIWENRRNDIYPTVEKIVQTESEAYRVAYEGQYKWIQTRIIDTGSMKQPSVRPRRSNYVWSGKDLRALLSLYEDEMIEIREYDQETWTVHPYTLDI
jgi:hypothetical protein